MRFTDKKLLRVQKQSEGEITELVGFTDKKLLRVQKLSLIVSKSGFCFTDKKLLRVQKLVKKEAIKETVLLIRNY